MSRYLKVGAAGEVKRPCNKVSDLPRCALIKVARHLLIGRNDPSSEEGTTRRFQFIHTFIDRAYRFWQCLLLFISEHRIEKVLQCVRRRLLFLFFLRLLRLLWLIRLLWLRLSITQRTEKFAESARRWFSPQNL